MGSEGYDRGWGQTSLGDMPESCVAAVLLYLDPPEICHVARLNHAFRGTASADCVWAAKLPATYCNLAALAAVAAVDAAEGNGRCCSSAAIKKDIYARLCRPVPLNGGTKVGCCFPLLVLCTCSVLYNQGFLCQRKAALYTNILFFMV
jgi:hypothetical protein